MPKKIKSFTIHLNNVKTDISEVKQYLEDNFGISHDGDQTYWYLGRNYNRPGNESYMEITFYSEFNKYHTLMMFKHPFTIIDIDADEWYEVDTTIFQNLFEVLQ